jgi:hypothetical protein
MRLLKVLKQKGVTKMGYRSQVAYVIAFDDDADTKVMGQFINYVMGSGDEHLIEALKECEVDFDLQRINFYASDVKWYDSYDEVKAHTKLYELCVNEETPFYPHAHARFVRVGEESGDIQEEDFGDDPPYDEFYTHTDIRLPFDCHYRSYGTTLDELTQQQPTKGDVNED